jgi:hypothetical protein
MRIMVVMQQGSVPTTIKLEIKYEIKTHTKVNATLSRSFSIKDRQGN